MHSKAGLSGTSHPKLWNLVYTQAGLVEVLRGWWIGLALLSGYEMLFKPFLGGIGRRESLSFCAHLLPIAHVFYVQCFLEQYSENYSLLSSLSAKQIQCSGRE